MTRSGHEPLVFLHTVKRDEGQQDGHGLDEFLILGILAVVLVLADLQTAGTGEHDKDDAAVTDCAHEPLPAPDGANAGDQHAGPEDHLAQIVRATDDPEQARVDKAAGIDLFGPVLLDVGCGLQRDAADHDDRADEDKGIVGGYIAHAVEHRGDLGGIEQGAGDPDSELDAHGHRFAVFDLADHILFIGAALKLAVSEIAAQTAAIAEEDDAADDRAGSQGLAEEDQHQQAGGCDGEAVAEGDEPYVVFEADGADQHSQSEKEPEIPGRIHDEKPSFLLCLCYFRFDSLTKSTGPCTPRRTCR